MSGTAYCHKGSDAADQPAFRADPVRCAQVGRNVVRFRRSQPSTVVIGGRPGSPDPARQKRPKSKSCPRAGTSLLPDPSRGEPEQTKGVAGPLFEPAAWLTPVLRRAFSPPCAAERPCLMSSPTLPIPITSRHDRRLSSIRLLGHPNENSNSGTGSILVSVWFIDRNRVGTEWPR